MNDIKFYRIKKGLSQKELAILCHISKSYLSRLENGTRNNPSLNLMKSLTKHLGADIEDIFWL